MFSIKHFGILAVAVFVSSAFAAKKIEMSAGDILSRIHSTNQEEISAGQLAQQKAYSPAVKQYAEELEKDHTKADKKVTDLAKELNVTLTTTPMPKSAKEGGKMVKHVATTAELKSMEAGPKFDKAYLEAMENGHHDVIEMLEHAKTDNAKVQKLVAELLPELRKHKRIASHLGRTVTK